MDTKEYIEKQELQKQKEFKDYLQKVEDKKKDIKNFVKKTIATGLVFGSILTGTACGIKNPNNQTTTNPNQTTTLDTTTSTIGTDTTGTTTDFGKIDEPILTEKERYQKALKNFEKAIMVVKNNHDDTPIHYLRLFKREYKNKECEYGIYLDAFIDSEMCRISEYSLSKEDYEYASEVYENKNFIKNELLTKDYRQTFVSGNLENIKNKSDSVMLNAYSQAILDKEHVNQSQFTEEFEKYYALLNEKRGEISNSFLIDKNTTFEGEDVYSIYFTTPSGKYYPSIYSVIEIDKTLADQIAQIYKRDTAKILNLVLDKDEFIIKADDSVLEQVTNQIKNRVQMIEQYEKQR